MGVSNKTANNDVRASLDNCVKNRYPTALLPSQGVRWQAVDDYSANATIVDGPLTLTLLFRFNDDDLMASFRAEARGGMVDKVVVMAPWEGRWSNYKTQDGMTVPFTGWCGACLFRPSGWLS